MREACSGRQPNTAQFSSVDEVLLLLLPCRLRGLAVCSRTPSATGCWRCSSACGHVMMGINTPGPPREAAHQELATKALREILARYGMCDWTPLRTKVRATEGLQAGA